jgi:heat shock protein beta
MMTDLAKTNETAYNTFWKNFGKYLKVGIIEDEKSRDDLVPLCRFFSSRSDNLTSLPDYVARMPEDQKFVYYVVGETRAQAAESPVLEKLKQKGYEVLYVCEPIDEMTLQNIEKLGDKTITDAGRESIQDLSDEEKKDKDKKNEDLEGFRTWMKGILGEKVIRVEVSTRLVDSPATLVQSEYGVSPTMQKYLRAQAVVEEDNAGQFSNVFNQAVLEINPSHPVIERLTTIHGIDKDSEEAKETVNMVFNTAALAAGYSLDNAAEYSKMVVKIMTALAQKQ